MGAAKNDEQFRRDVFDLTADEFVPLEPYRGSKTRIRMLHRACGSELNMMPNSFFASGVRCKFCYHRSVGLRDKKTQQQFEEEVLAKTQGEYLVAGNYLGKSKKIEMIHTTCGHAFEVTPTNFLSRNSRCSHCNKERLAKAGIEKRKTHEDFVREVFEAVGNEYRAIGTYRTTRVKLKMEHVLCGCVWSVTPNNFLSKNSRCPKCDQSKGEKFIDKVLADSGARYKQQFRFEDCRDKRTLPFDFAVLGEDACPFFLIEYDGIQHFLPTFGEDKLAGTVRRDAIKNSYCAKNGIPLLRIPYTMGFDRIRSVIESLLRLNAEQVRKELSDKRRAKRSG